MTKTGGSRGVFVRDIFERGARALYGKPRGDERFRHVTDLLGCDLATAARLRKLPLMDFPVSKLVQFELGHAAENIVADALAEALKADGWIAQRDVLAWLQCEDDSLWGGRLSRMAYEDGRLLAILPSGLRSLEPKRTVVGHVDQIFTRGDEVLPLIECKSTVFERGKADGVKVVIPPFEAKWAHQFQAAAYALALGFERFCIPVVDRDSGQYEFFPREKDPPLLAAAFAEPIMAAMKTLFVNLAGEELPAPQPPEHAYFARSVGGKLVRANYVCEGCRYANCALNPHALEAAI